MVTIEEKIKNIFPFDNILLLKLDILPAKKIILTIGKKKGATLDDCEKISKVVRPIIGDEYYLQVQSTGIGWKIDVNSKTSDIFIGEKVKITFVKDGKTKTEEGILKSIDAEKVTIKTLKNEITILKENIKKLKTTF